MSSIVIAPASPDGDNGNPQGHCSRCHRVWIPKNDAGRLSVVWSSGNMPVITNKAPQYQVQV